MSMHTFSVSLTTISQLHNYTTTVIIDCDWVPRMSLHSVTRLREEILDAIARARVHKLVILQAMFKVRIFLHSFYLYYSLVLLSVNFDLFSLTFTRFTKWTVFCRILMRTL